MNKSILRPTLVMFLVLTLVVGFMYPLLITGLAKGIFPKQAGGSIVLLEGKPAGSALIGQNFSDPKHFWGRPSATSPQPYSAMASGGSNQGPLNPALVDAVKARVEALRAVDPGNPRPVPVDLVTASASGLDPHISVSAAIYQVDRIARIRALPSARVQALVDQNIERPPLLPFIGEPVVNVLRLNLELDSLR